MLYAVSGAQGSGKTTVLQELQKRGFFVLERKTSRSIQHEWGYTLEEVNRDKELTIKFQWEIIDRKLCDENNFIDGVDTTAFTERTYADLFTYALAVLGKEPSCDDFLNKYYDRCERLQWWYGKVFYLTAGHFDVVPDPHRGAPNKHYTRMIDMVMLDVTRQITNPNRLVIIDTPDLQERVNIIMENL